MSSSTSQQQADFSLVSKDCYGNLSQTTSSFKSAASSSSHFDDINFIDDQLIGKEPPLQKFDTDDDDNDDDDEEEEEEKKGDYKDINSFESGQQQQKPANDLYNFPWDFKLNSKALLLKTQPNNSASTSTLTQLMQDTNHEVSTKTVVAVSSRPSSGKQQQANQENQEPDENQYCAPWDLKLQENMLKLMASGKSTNSDSLKSKENNNQNSVNNTSSTIGKPSAQQQQQQQQQQMNSEDQASNEYSLPWEHKQSILMQSLQSNDAKPTETTKSGGKTTTCDLKRNNSTCNNKSSNNNSSGSSSTHSSSSSLSINSPPLLVNAANQQIILPQTFTSTLNEHSMQKNQHLVHPHQFQENVLGSQLSPNSAHHEFKMPKQQQQQQQQQQQPLVFSNKGYAYNNNEQPFQQQHILVHKNPTLKSQMSSVIVPVNMVPSNAFDSLTHHHSHLHHQLSGSSLVSMNFAEPSNQILVDSAGGKFLMDLNNPLVAGTFPMATLVLANSSNGQLTQQNSSSKLQYPTNHKCPMMQAPPPPPLPTGTLSSLYHVTLPQSAILENQMYLFIKISYLSAYIHL